MEQLHEYKGVLHVHTSYSDSSVTMPEVVRIARRAGLDYVVVSDHNTLRAKQDGWQGWHEGVLVVVGVEITSTKGHVLALGLDRTDTWAAAHPDEYLPEVARRGGTAFVAHPERNDRGKLYRRPQAWPDLATDDYAGIEIWSYLHDWVEGVYPWHLLVGLRDPDARIAGPHPLVLRRWDQVALRRHCAGIAALDSHERRYPIPRFRWPLLKVLPTEFLFRTARTHVLAPAWAHRAATDVVALTDALAAGRCFAAYDLLGDATGTRFSARGGGEVAVMGDEVAEGGELEFAATVPLDAELTLVRNAEPAARETGTELVHRDARPGVYRVEARLRNRPWVYTNHIYVRGGGSAS
ncbi:MAG: CehA/McbA family metallohydrolase [Planctomycetota bacterium]